MTLELLETDKYDFKDIRLNIFLWFFSGYIWLNWQSCLLKYTRRTVLRAGRVIMSLGTCLSEGNTVT